MSAITNYQKDILIADLQRQIYERCQQSQNIPDNRSLFNELEQKCIKQESNLKLIIQENLSILTKSQQQIDDLIQTKLTLQLQQYENVYEQTFLMQQKELNSKCDLLLNLMQDEQQQRNYEALQIQESGMEVLFLEDQLNQALFDKQIIIETYEDQQDKNQAFIIQVHQMEEYLQEIQTKRVQYDENLNETTQQQYQVNYCRQCFKLEDNFNKIETEDQQLKAHQQNLMEDLSLARQLIQSLNQITEQLVQDGNEQESLLNEQQRNITYIEAQYEHLQEVYDNQKQHLLDISVKIKSSSHDILNISGDKKGLRQELSTKHDNMKMIQDSIQEMVEYLIRRGHDNEILEKVVNQRNSLNERVHQQLKQPRSSTKTGKPLQSPFSVTTQFLHSQTIQSPQKMQIT